MIVILRHLIKALIILLISNTVVQATMIDVADQSFTHFANFSNDPPAGALSNISSNTAPEAFQGYGWHDSPSSLPGIAGIILDSEFAVTSLRLQVHVNPFKDFILQGSNNTTTGWDGSWANLFSSTVTNRTELDWQEWSFANTNAYSAYRIYAVNDYVGGWAMYRWDLLADDSIADISEPNMVVFLGLGLCGLLAYRRKSSQN